MKTFISVVITLVISFNLNAQSNDNSILNKVFNKVVLDFGAAQNNLLINSSDQMSTYNYALGYQLSQKLDIRMNLDYFNFIYQGFNPNNIINSPNLENLFGLSMGLNFKALNGKETTFLKNTSIGFVGKFGVIISRNESVQQGYFYDLSTRIYFGKIPYIGLGYNQMFTDFRYSDISSLYLSFGIDF